MTDILKSTKTITDEAVKFIEMAVDRATAKEPIKVNGNIIKCPTCGKHFIKGKSYCDRCGQKIKAKIGER